MTGIEKKELLVSTPNFRTKKVMSVSGDGDLLALGFQEGQIVIVNMSEKSQVSSFVVIIYLIYS
jgi:hypothetical protein